MSRSVARRRVGDVKRSPAMAVVGAFVTACAGTGPSATTVPGTTAAGAVPPGVVMEVNVFGAEGLVIAGTLRGVDPTTARPAVLLLHMRGSDRSAWAGFAGKLAAAGWVSLAIDLRGHGATGGEEDYDLAPQDVRAAWDWLRAAPGVDPKRVAMAGASVGANLALVVGAEVRAPAVIALSPGLDYRGVVVDQAVAALGDIPVMLVAEEGDTYSADSVEALVEVDPAAEVVVGGGSAHGTDMLDDDLESRLIDFLTDVLA